MTTDELVMKIGLGKGDLDYLLGQDISRRLIAELAARDREVAELRDDLAEERRRVDHAGDVLESRVYSLDESYEREQVARDAAWRWWKQARENNYDAWAHIRNLERALQESDNLQRRAKRAEEEVKEYAFLFELQKDRLDEAIAAWREATGQHNVSPDLGVLLEWLLNRIDELEANLAMAEHDNVLTSPQVSADRDTKTGADLCQTLIEFIETDHDYGCECAACRAIAAYREHTKVALEATITQEETDD